MKKKTKLDYLLENLFTAFLSGVGIFMLSYHILLLDITISILLGIFGWLADALHNAQHDYFEDRIKRLETKINEL